MFNRIAMKAKLPQSSLECPTVCTPSRLLCNSPFMSGPIRNAERMSAEQIGQQYHLSMIQLPLVGFAESPSRALWPMELVPLCKVV